MKIEDIVKAVQENDCCSLDKLLRKLAAKRLKKQSSSGSSSNLISLNMLVAPQNVAPLHIAAACGCLEACRLLLEQSAFVDVEDPRGARPLHYACANAQPAIARLLLDWGATASRPVLHDGRSPLHCAVVGVRRSNQLDFMHRTLSVACELGAARSGANANNTAAELIGILLEHDADVGVRDATGRTPLEYACELGNVEFLTAFVATESGRRHVEAVCTRQLEQLRDAECECESNAVPATIDWPPFTASHLAAKNGHVAILRVLCNSFISLGVLQLRSASGTPLHEAVLNARLDTVEFLVQNGVDVGIRNSHGHTALDLTCLLETGGADRSLVDSIRRVLTTASTTKEESANNGAAMWRSYVTNDSLFGEQPRVRISTAETSLAQSPRHRRQSFNENTVTVFDSMQLQMEMVPQAFATAASRPVPLPFQLPLETSGLSNKLEQNVGVGVALYNNLTAIGYVAQGPDDGSQIGCHGVQLASPSGVKTPSIGGVGRTSIYMSARDPAISASSHCCSASSHCRMASCQSAQVSVPFAASAACQYSQMRCQCQCQCPACSGSFQAATSVCCQHNGASAGVNPASHQHHHQSCVCAFTKLEASLEESYRHSSASVDSGHASNDLKHMHSPISPCDSVVSSSRNSAHSGSSGQPCLSYHNLSLKNQHQHQHQHQHQQLPLQLQLQQHGCCYHQADCGLPNVGSASSTGTGRFAPNSVALNVMPPVTLNTPGVGNAAASAAGSSSGSSSQGDMESGVSFSSMSSLENIDEYFLEDPLDLHALFADGLSDNDVLQHWLNALQLPEYYENFVGSGYDIATIARMTPEDLTAIGITNPKHRRRLRAELRRLNVDLPHFSKLPSSLYEWLATLKLDCYYRLLSSQGYASLEKVAHNLTWDDMEDIGIVLLGHQKKLTLSIGRLRKMLQCGTPTEPNMPTERSSEAHCPHGNCQCARREQSTHMNAAEKVLADILHAAEHNRLSVVETDADGVSIAPADGTDGIPATLKSLRTLDRLRETAELSRSCGNVNGMEVSHLSSAAVVNANINAGAGSMQHGGHRMDVTGMGMATGTGTGPNSAAFAANLQAAYTALRGMQQTNVNANHDSFQMQIARANLPTMHSGSPHHARNQPYASPLLSRHHPNLGNAPAVPKRQHSLPSRPIQSGIASPLQVRRTVGATSETTHQHPSLHDSASASQSQTQNVHYRTLPRMRSHAQRISSLPEQDECESMMANIAQQQQKGSNCSAQSLRGSTASIDSVNTSAIPFANDNCGTIRQRVPHANANVNVNLNNQLVNPHSRSQQEDRDAAAGFSCNSCTSQSLTSSPTIKGGIRKTFSGNSNGNSNGSGGIGNGCFSPGSSLSSSSSSCSSANTVLVAPGTTHDSAKSVPNLDDLNSILNDLTSAFDSVLKK